MTLVTLEDGSYVPIDHIEDLQTSLDGDLSLASPRASVYNHNGDFNIQTCHSSGCGPSTNSLDAWLPSVQGLEGQDVSSFQGSCSSSSRQTPKTHISQKQGKTVDYAECHAMYQGRPHSSEPQSTTLSPRDIAEANMNSSSFHTLDFHGLGSIPKRTRTRRRGPSCLGCWISKMKCVGEFPCNRCIARKNSKVITSQPCVPASISFFEFDALYPYENGIKFQNCFVPTIVESGIVQMPLNKALSSPTMLFRMIMITFHLFKLLKWEKPSKPYLSLPVSPDIVNLFYFLDMLNRFDISLRIQLYEEPAGVDPTLVALSLVYLRAKICHKLFQALEKFLKCRLVSSAPKEPDLLWISLRMLHRELRRATISTEQRSSAAQVLCPAPEFSDLMGHLTKWLEFMLDHIDKRRCNKNDIQSTTLSRSGDCGHTRTSTPMPQEYYGSLQVLDMWTGDVIGEVDNLDQDKYPLYEMGPLVRRVLGPLQAEEVLRLDRVYLKNGSVYDFVTQEFVGLDPEDLFPYKLVFELSNLGGLRGIQDLLAFLVGELTTEERKDA